MIDDEDDVNETENGDEEAEAEDGGEEALEAGFHVRHDGEYNSGPYESEEAAQSFIDAHLGGNGEVFEVSE